MGDGHVALAAEGTGGDLYTGRGLATKVPSVRFQEYVSTRSEQEGRPQRLMCYQGIEYSYLAQEALHLDYKGDSTCQ